MNQRALLYFSLAFLPALFQANEPPTDTWAFAKWLGLALYQGLLALKALQSLPGSTPP
jgi:hypothetical protein